MYDCKIISRAKNGVKLLGRVLNINKRVDQI